MEQIPISAINMARRRMDRGGKQQQIVMIMLHILLTDYSSEEMAAALQFVEQNSFV